MNIFIITGISGSGKTAALKCFEDLGYFCIDNFPISLSREFIELCKKHKNMRKIALCIDVREGNFLSSFSQMVQWLRESGYNYKIIYFDAKDDVLLRRFSETRRRHPLGTNLLDAIQKERKLLEHIKVESDKIIDTSNFTLSDLKNSIVELIGLRKRKDVRILVISFGYKYGIPLDADIVMDVRFLPNPNYIPTLKNSNGEDPRVKQYVLNNPVTKSFISYFFPLIKNTIPLYIKEGKSYLTIAIGCTGGRHRSVVIANELGKYIEDKAYTLIIRHRDINKP
jgi:UPF0042 nucleotide-binding protein